MKNALRAAFLALSAFLWLPGQAMAQGPQCAARDVIIDRLQQKYGEAPVAFGVARDGRLVEIFVGPAGSWTVVKTRPGGLSCMVDAGEGWRSLKPKNTDPEA